MEWPEEGDETTMSDLESKEPGKDLDRGRKSPAAGSPPEVPDSARRRLPLKAGWVVPVVMAIAPPLAFAQLGTPPAPPPPPPP